MPSLFHLTEEFRAIADYLADTDLDPETLADTLEGEVWAVEEKAQSVALVVLSLQAEAKAIKDREDAMKSRRESVEKRAESLSQYLSDCLRRADISKIEGADVKLSFRRSEVVEVADESAISAEYFAVPAPRLDKAKLKSDLKAGKAIPGATLVTRQNLQIK